MHGHMNVKKKWWHILPKHCVIVPHPKMHILEVTEGEGGGEVVVVVSISFHIHVTLYCLTWFCLTCLTTHVPRGFAVQPT
jgi:hypothetical protein